MLQMIRRQFRTIATIGVASALVVGGLAAAQDGSGSPANGSSPGPPPPMGAGMGKDLTYAELHVQHDGQAEVLRLDQGKIASVDDSSITVTENDGSSVTIPLDENTDVLARPGQEATVDDLTAGEEVVVCGPEGGTAKSVVVVPKAGQMMMKGGPPHGGQFPPPPGA